MRIIILSRIIFAVDVLDRVLGYARRAHLSENTTSKILDQRRNGVVLNANGGEHMTTSRCPSQCDCNYDRRTEKMQGCRVMWLANKDMCMRLVRVA